MKLPLKLTNENNIYYNCNKCYSYNYFYNAIIGGRGIGKTTTFLIKGIQNVAKGEQFIYLRRYKPELKKFVTKDTLNKITEGVVYKGDGAGGYNFIVGNQVIGYGMLLSTSISDKSVQYPDVTTIIFDEAILKRGSTYRYLDDEIFVFLEFVSTIVRRRKNCKVILLGNNTDIFNPYFAYWNVPLFDNVYVNKERGIYCEMAKDTPALRKLEEDSPFYKLVQGTAYGDYHYENKVLTKERVSTKIKPKNCKILCRAIMNGYTLNFYVYQEDNKTRIYCEFREKIISDNISYLLLANNKPNYLYVDMFRKKFRSFLFRLYFNKRMDFNSEKAGELFSWITDKI